MQFTARSQEIARSNLNLGCTVRPAAASSQWGVRLTASRTTFERKSTLPVAKQRFISDFSKGKKTKSTGSLAIRWHGKSCPKGFRAESQFISKMRTQRIEQTGHASTNG